MRITMQGTYPERVLIDGREGKLIVERSRWSDGLTTTMLTAEISEGTSYSIAASTESELGQLLAGRSAVSLLVGLEDSLRAVSSLNNAASEDDPTAESWVATTDFGTCAAAVRHFIALIEGELSENERERERQQRL